MNCHSHWKVSSCEHQEFSRRKTWTKNPKKNRMPFRRGVVWMWWKSFLSSRPKSLILFFWLCPSSLLRKVPHCAISLLMLCVHGFYLRIHPLGCSRQSLRQLVSRKGNYRSGSIFYDAFQLLLMWKISHKYVQYMLAHWK